MIVSSSSDASEFLARVEAFYQHACKRCPKGWEVLLSAYGYSHQVRRVLFLAALDAKTLVLGLDVYREEPHPEIVIVRADRCSFFVSHMKTDGAPVRVEFRLPKDYDPAAEPSGRDEPLPSVSVTELASNLGRFPCLRRCAVGSGRSPETFGVSARLP